MGSSAHTLTLSSPPTQPSSLPKILSIYPVEGGGGGRSRAQILKKEEEKEVKKILKNNFKNNLKINSKTNSKLKLS